MKDEDEIYLIDLWRILLREWRWALAAMLVVLAITFAFTRVAKPQWEAAAWIRWAKSGRPRPAAIPRWSRSSG